MRFIHIEIYKERVQNMQKFKLILDMALMFSQTRGVQKWNY